MYSDEEIRQIILGTLADSDDISNNSFGILNATEDPRFVTILFAMLDEDNFEAVEAAIEAIYPLNQFKSAEFLPRIALLLENPSHCASAIRFISRRRSDVSTYLPRFIGFLAYPDVEIRSEGLRALWYSKHPDLLEICLYLLNDTAAKIRGLACTILDDFSGENVMYALISKLSDNEYTGENEDETVASIAAANLGMSSYKAAVEPLMATVKYGGEKAAASAIYALYRIEGDNLLDFLCEQISHPYANVRIEIAETLKYIQTTVSLETLLWVLENDPSEEVQFRASVALRWFESFHPKVAEARDKWEWQFKEKHDS